MRRVLLWSSAACFGLLAAAAEGGPRGASSSRVDSSPRLLKFLSTLAVRGPTDLVDAPGNNFYVQERLGDLLVLDKESLEIVRRVQVPRAIALTRDPTTGSLFVLGTTGERGPWQTVHTVDPGSLVVRFLYKLDEQYAFPEQAVGFSADGSGRLLINYRYGVGQPAVAVVDASSGAIVGRINVPGERSAPNSIADLPPHVLARWNAYRIRSTEAVSYALNVTTGAMAMLDSRKNHAARVFDVPKYAVWRGPYATEDGRGVVATFTAYDLAVDHEGNLLVLYNSNRPVIYSIATNGTVRGTFEFASESSSRVASNYDSVMALGHDKLLLASSYENRIDLFHAELSK